MNGHNKGPWYLDTDHGANAPEYIRANVDGEMLDVASVLCDETGNAAANARLIAAAPALLEALQNIIEHKYDSYPINWDAARAAVAQATGVKP